MFIVSLLGLDIFLVFEKGIIDVVDYVGLVVNYELGFFQVIDYIIFGFFGVMFIY